MTSTVQFVGSENPNSNVCWRGSRPARWISTFLCGCLGLMVLGLAMTPLGAQTVRGHVVDPVLGVPVGGALVELLNGDTGRVVAAAISDEDGNYELSATSTGRYFVTARRIGHDSVQSDSFLPRGLERAYEVQSRKS